MRSGGRTGIWLLTGVGVILIAAGLVWFLQNFERRSQEVDTGYSAAARRNPFLAAERVLTRLDVPVESVSGRDLLRDLPPTDDTLVVSGLGALNLERRSALHQWVEQGGQLIVEAVELWDETDPTGGRGDAFLSRYGVRLRQVADTPNGAVPPHDEAIATVYMEGYPHPVAVGFAARYYLEDTNGEATGGIAAGELLRLAQYRIGEGVLTVSSDNRYMTNSHIGDHDNALFLSLSLLAPPSGGGKVWLLYDSGIPWLGALLWRQAPFAAISFLCLIGLFLWNLGGRLGPLLPSATGDRRDLLAHLQASADFLWRHRQTARLTEVTRERVDHAWIRRHPAVRDMDHEARAAWIARRAGIEPGQVQQTLYPPTPVRHDLVAEATLLQRLWACESTPGDHPPFTASARSFATGPINLRRPPIRT